MAQNTRSGIKGTSEGANPVFTGAVHINGKKRKKPRKREARRRRKVKGASLKKKGGRTNLRVVVSYNHK